MRKAALLVAVLFAASLHAAPVITLLSPSAGPITGGTTVTIKGSGFTTCPICSPPLPPAAFFGGSAALSTFLVDASTLEVVTPAHGAGVVDVTVSQYDGDATLPSSFRYFDPHDEFETVLVPVLLPPVAGAFGSEFHTEFRLYNASSTGLEVNGLPGCALCDPPVGNPTVLQIAPHTEVSWPENNGSPGRLLYLPDGRGRDLAMNLRVYDVSREALNFGTEIPVVREAEFGSDPITLVGVPSDARFRNTLRIYRDSPLPTFVLVTVGDEAPQAVTLSAGADQFTPAYAEFTAFPVAMPPGGPRRIVTQRVVVEVPPTLSPLPSPRIWAFVSTTNNETQAITTITPH